METVVAQYIIEVNKSVSSALVIRGMINVLEELSVVIHESQVIFVGLTNI